MSAQLSELRGQIVIDAQILGDRNFPLLRLNRMVNLAQRYVQIQLNGLGMNKWLAQETVTAGLSASAYNSGTNNVKALTIGTTYLDDMLEAPNAIKHFEVNSGGDPASYGIARPIDIDEFDKILSNPYMSPTITEPRFCRVGGTKVLLAPVTIAVATAYYYKVIADLSSDSDLTQIPLEFEEFIIKRAVIEIETILGKIEKKEIALRDLDKEISQSYEKFIGKQFEENRLKQDDKMVLQ